MLTKEEAIGAAEKAVRERYSLVPPVGQAIMIPKNVIELNRGLLPEIVLDISRQKYAGKWLVCFHCSWDTDELGLPISLIVLVDSKTGRTEIVAGEREGWSPPWN
jgi:hypothetical protein